MDLKRTPWDHRSSLCRSEVFGKTITLCLYYSFGSGTKGEQLSYFSKTLQFEYKTIILQSPYFFQ